jgi:hypothetical protein
LRRVKTACFEGASWQRPPGKKVDSSSAAVTSAAIFAVQIAEHLAANGRIHFFKKEKPPLSWD